MLIGHFSHGDVTMAVRRFGSGERPMLAIHGYGKSGEDFRALEEALGGRFTIYAVDLPFHGSSPGDPTRVQRPFQATELSAFFVALLAHLGLRSVRLLAHSLGARVAASIISLQPLAVEEVTLLAPDGLRPKPWYRRPEENALGRRAADWCVENHRTVAQAIAFLRARRLIPGSVYRNLSSLVESRESAVHARDVWFSFRLLDCDWTAILGAARRHAFAINMVFGRYDRLVRARDSAPLVGLGSERLRIFEVERGHHVVTPESANLCWPPTEASQRSSRPLEVEA